MKLEFPESLPDFDSSRKRCLDSNDHARFSGGHDGGDERHAGGMTSEAIRARHERCGECSECDRHRDVEALLVRVKDLENAIANARMLIKVGVGGNTYITMEPMKCGKYIGDNDATCPQLTCIRERGHDGLCDNVNGD